jgi:hypothetical protein
MASLADNAPTVERDRIVGRFGDIARDMARGGLAGLAVGVVVGGLGGRVVMRLAALLVPDSAGRFTENGNQIGTITLAGSVGLIVFAGLVVGLAVGIVWVTVSPWIPGSGLRRALLTMPIAVALSGVFLVRGDNTDFLVLGNDALVVGLLIGLIAVLGLTIALLDDVLERRLPRVGPAPSKVLFGYAVVASIGLVFVVPIAGAYLGEPLTFPMGVALLAAGAATIAWWALRLRGDPSQPRNLRIAGRAALLASVVLGTAALVPEMAGALGIR